jgi:CBS-domain-containing membrane protein
MVLRAREIMTDRVVSVAPGTPVTVAREWLADGRFTALPVVDERNRLVGIVSAGDLVDPRVGEEATVGAVMSRDVLSAHPDTDVGIIAHRLNTYGGVRVMPIVDQGFLVGIVTRGDLLRPRARGGPLGRAVRRALGRRHGYTRTVPVAAWAGRLPHPDTGAAGPTARDVMTATGLLTVRGTTPVEAAAAVLTGARLTAVPVVDEQDRLVGIVSEADLVRDPLDGRRVPPARTVAGVMTTDVVSLSPDAGVPELARLMSGHGLRVVPIVEGGRLVGVVTRGDLLRAGHADV